MSEVVYWMTTSLDGFVETRDGTIDWAAPDHELFLFLNECARRVGAFLRLAGEDLAAEVSSKEVAGDLSVCGASNPAVLGIVGVPLGVEPPAWTPRSRDLDLAVLQIVWSTLGVEPQARTRGHQNLRRVEPGGTPNRRSTARSTAKRVTAGSSG